MPTPLKFFSFFTRNKSKKKKFRKLNMNFFKFMVYLYPIPIILLRNVWFVFFGNILTCKSWNLDGLTHIWYIYPKEFLDGSTTCERTNCLYQISLVAAISLLICHSFKYNYPISKNSLAVLWIECLNARISLYIFFNRYNRISTYEYNDFFIVMLRY